IRTRPGASLGGLSDCRTLRSSLHVPLKSSIETCSEGASSDKVRDQIMVGERIGKYRVTRQVGRGGMGTVYAAVDELLHREVAIKVLNAGLEDPTVARRFHAEAIAVARLNHPGIAAIYELFEHDGQQLMVMEFVRGNT